MTVKEIRKRLEKVMGETVSLDPPTKQAKELSYLTAETLLQAINTLDKMDETNKELDASNKDLAHSNLQLAQRNLWLQVIIASISVIALLVALFLHR